MSKIVPKVTKVCEYIGCKKSFEVSIYRDATAKFCCRTCKDLSQTLKTSWNSGLSKKEYISKQVELNNTCLNCPTAISSDRKYCSHSCQRSYQNKQMAGKTYEELYGVEKAIEIKAKSSASISAKAKKTGFTKIGAKAAGDARRGKTYEEQYGTEKAEEVKDGIRKGLDEFRQTPEGIEIRKQASERGIRLAATGKEFANTKKGYYKEVYYGSSLELLFLEQFERLVGTLEFVKRNDIAIPRINQEFDWYKTIPDYKIVKDNKILALIECKSEHLLERPTVVNKILSLNAYTKIPTGLYLYKTEKTLKHFNDNPDPRWLNSFTGYCQMTLHQFIVNHTEQRLNVESKELNKTFKDEVRQTSSPTTHNLIK